MGTKQQLYVEFLRKEGYAPEELENGDVRFKYQGEVFVVTSAEDDSNYFKLSYYHAWDGSKTATAWPALNSLNAAFKVVKVSALGDVICLTTEILLKAPEDFEVLFGRCLHAIVASKTKLAAAVSS